MSKAKSNVTTDFVLPIVVLVLICAVMSGLLAVTNNITAPIIDEAERAANTAARKEVMPLADAAGDADPFEEIKRENLPESAAANMPASITGVYKATNSAGDTVGYTFSITAQGYGGKNTLKMTVGVDADGKVTGVKVLEHKETPGLGSKITTDKRFIGDFEGKGAAEIDGIDRISGATFSSNYYKAAIKDALKAFELVKG